MAARNSTPAPLAPYRGAIPGHLRELRSSAGSAGIVVRFGLLASEYDEPARLCARLTGSPSAFERAGLVRPGFQCVRYRRVQHGPFPLRFKRTARHELCADVIEDPPQLVEKRGRVEVAMYEGRWDDRTERAYWGRPQAVAAALKVPAGRLAPGKRSSTCRSGYDQILGGFRWHARFYPSGGVRLVLRDDPPKKARFRQRIESARADADFQAFLARVTDPRCGADPSR